jgi:hypothetical protein
MDSDVMLAELRALIANWQAAGSRNDGPDPWTERKADRAIELMADLDARLTRGGRPPTDWAPPRTSRTSRTSCHF